MIHFIESSQLNEIVTEKNVGKFIIPVAVDEPTENPYYQAIVKKYPETQEKFQTSINQRPLRAGEVRRVQLSSGQSIYFITVKAVNKFAAYLVHIVGGIEQALEMIAKEANTPEAAKVVIPLPSSDELKLSEPIYVSAVCQVLNHPTVDVYAITNRVHEPYIEKVEDGVVYLKRDSFKPEWMMSIDDIMLVEVLATTVRLTHNFKINKQNLVKCYYLMHQGGKFERIEWYETEYGPFFKMFLPKMMGLTANGLLLNIFHMSKVEPPRFSAVMGPYYHLMKHLAYSQLEKMKPEIFKFAKELRAEYFNSFNKDKEDGGNKASQGNTTPPKNQSSNFSF